MMGQAPLRGKGSLESSFVHLTRVAAVVSTLLVSAPAFSQGWIEYINHDQPSIQEITNTSWRGATLPARVYAVEDGPDRYSVTVVNYTPTRM